MEMHILYLKKTQPMKIKFTTVNSTSRYNANLIRSFKTQRGPVGLSFLLQELKITCCKLYSVMGCRKYLKVQMEGIFFRTRQLKDGKQSPNLFTFFIQLSTLCTEV